MNEAEFKQFADFLNTLADESKKITLDGFNSDKQLKIKDDGSPVTEYDINAEKIICELISEKFPDHSILAEENGTKKLDSDYTWILDPIDGTRSFIIGRPLWGTLICLTFKGMPIIGLADFPALNERWLGYEKNCFLNNCQFKSNHVFTNDISQATLGSTGPSLFSQDGKKKYDALINATRYHVWSGDCHNYCLIIKGGLDLVVEQGLAAYDIFPLIPILKSQDITITDWIGNQLHLDTNFSSKYSTLVAKDTDVYKSAINILK
jgi:inositol-phosphate phosphatase/L-galactose 1-phosphate phosphatase/histidinol-phosphatase